MTWLLIIYFVVVAGGSLIGSVLVHQLQKAPSEDDPGVL
jgi:hypothetical protein